MKLNCQDLLDWVRSIAKTRQNNDVIDCIGVVYIKNKIKLSWSIKQGEVYEESDTR